MGGLQRGLPADAARARRGGYQRCILAGREAARIRFSGQDGAGMGGLQRGLPADAARTHRAGQERCILAGREAARIRVRRRDCA
eukprot:11309-Hanusia_phi.AAC.1